MSAVVSIKNLKLFVEFAAKELGLNTLPKIEFVGNSEDSLSAFGHSIGDKIVVRITQRHPIDVMRTIAHEMVHFHQYKTRRHMSEDEANAIAGRIMRKFDLKYPYMFKHKPIPKSAVKEESMVAANAVGAGGMGGDSAGPIQGYDPLMKMKPLKRKLLPGIKRTMGLNNIQSPKKLRDIISGGLKSMIAAEYKNERRSNSK